MIKLRFTLALALTEKTYIGVARTAPDNPVKAVWGVSVATPPDSHPSRRRVADLSAVRGRGLPPCRIDLPPDAPSECQEERFDASDLTKTNCVCRCFCRQLLFHVAWGIARLCPAP